MPQFSDAPQLALAVFLAMTAAIATAPCVRGLARTAGIAASVAELPAARADSPAAPSGFVPSLFGP